LKPIPIRRRFAVHQNGRARVLVGDEGEKPFSKIGFNKGDISPDK